MTFYAQSITSSCAQGLVLEGKEREQIWIAEAPKSTALLIHSSHHTKGGNRRASAEEKGLALNNISGSQREPAALRSGVDLMRKYGPLKKKSEQGSRVS